MAFRGQRESQSTQSVSSQKSLSESGKLTLLKDLLPHAVGFACARALIILISYDGYIHSDAGFSTEGISLLIVLTLLIIIGALKLLKIKRISQRQLHAANLVHTTIGALCLIGLTWCWIVGGTDATALQGSTLFGLQQEAGAVLSPRRGAFSLHTLEMLSLFFKYAVSVCSIWYLFSWIRSVRGSSPHVILSFVLVGVVISEIIIYPISLLSVGAQNIGCFCLLVLPVMLHKWIDRREPLDEKYPYELGTSLLSSQETITNVSYLISLTVGIALLAIPVGMARGFPGGDPIAFTGITKSIYVVLIMVVAFAWFFYDAQPVKKGLSVVGPWIVGQLLVAGSACLYLAFPERLDFGAIFATVANVYLLIMLWQTEGILFTVGRHSMIVYFTCCYAAYMIPRALGRLVVSRIYEITENGMVVAGLIFFFTLISAQLIFAYLLMSRGRIINRINDACPVVDSFSRAHAVSERALEPAVSLHSSQPAAGGVLSSPHHTICADGEAASALGGDKPAPTAQAAQAAQAEATAQAAATAPVGVQDELGSRHAAQGLQQNYRQDQQGDQLGVLQDQQGDHQHQLGDHQQDDLQNQPHTQLHVHTGSLLVEQPAPRYAAIETLFGLESCVEGPLDERLSVLQHSIAKIGKQFQLSEREMQILTFFALGYTQKRVAETLNLSPGTVHSHIKRIYNKTDFHSRQDVLNYIELQDRELNN